jgi:hypothetical protein
MTAFRSLRSGTFDVDSHLFTLAVSTVNSSMSIIGSPDSMTCRSSLKNLRARSNG